MKVRASVSVMVLMGITWILGPLMLLDMVPGLNHLIPYLFTVSNSLQVGRTGALVIRNQWFVDLIGIWVDLDQAVKLEVCVLSLR